MIEGPGDNSFTLLVFANLGFFSARYPVLLLNIYEILFLIFCYFITRDGRKWNHN